MQSEFCVVFRQRQSFYRKKVTSILLDSLNLDLREESQVQSCEDNEKSNGQNANVRRFTRTSLPYQIEHGNLCPGQEGIRR